MGILHSMSGGIDSTSVLYQLVEAGHEVTTFHVDLASYNNLRWQSERIAVANILRWFAERDRKIVHIDGGRTDVSGSWYDIEVMAVHIGNHLRANGMIEATTESTSATDVLDPSLESRRVNRWTITEIVARRQPKWLRPNIEKTREQVIRELPKDLLRLTSFCRAPVQKNGIYLQCGVCQTCKQTLPYIEDSGWHYQTTAQYLTDSSSEKPNGSKPLTISS